MWIRRISFVSAVLRLPTLTWEKQVAGLPGFVYILYYKYIDIYIHTNMYQFVVDYMDVSQLLGNDGSGIYGPSLDRIEVILYYGATLKNAATKFARAQFDIGRRQI